MTRILFLFFLALSLNAFSQTPQGINYQAVAHDNTGATLNNQAISVRIGIISSSISGLLEWEETHSVTTNSYGLFDLVIGQGITTGTGNQAAFANISWSTASHFMKVEVDAGTGYENLGTSQLLSVPYALHAKTVEIDAVDDADSDASNELIVSGVLNGTDLEITDAGGTTTIDMSPLSGSGDNWGTQTAVTDATLSGDGTAATPLTVVGDLTDDQTLIYNSGLQTLDISGGNQVTLDVNDADADANNELLTGGIMNGTDLELTDAGGITTIDMSSLTSSDTLPVIKNAGNNTFVSAINNSDVEIGFGGSTYYRLDNLNRILMPLNNESVFIGGIPGGTAQTTGTGNIGLGASALNLVTSGSINVGLGQGSLENLNSGNFNVALGLNAMIGTTTGGENVALGRDVMVALTTGDNNVALGTNALDDMNGNTNIGIGRYSGDGVDDGYQNIFLGYNAGTQTGPPAAYQIGSIKIGTQAGLDDPTNNKLYIGHGPAKTLIYGNLDNDSLKVFGSLSVAEEYTFPLTDGSAGEVMSTDGAGQLSWGPAGGTIDEITDADSDTKIQVEEGPDDDEIRFDVAGNELMRLENQTLHLSDAGNNNLFVGDDAGVSNTVGLENTAFGREALNGNVSGMSNTAIGDRALKFNTSGMLNTAVGLWSLTNNTTGGSNTAVGRNTLRDKVTGGDNVAFGESSGVQMTSGDQNTLIGTLSASNKINGSQNVFLGTSSGTNNTSGNGNVFLGFSSGFNETGSNKLFIENSNSSTPLIYGNFASDSVKINGSLSIAEEYTFPLTDGSAGEVMSTDGAGQLSWGPANAGTKLQDVDNDTYVDVEQSADDDFVRFGTAGTERMVVDPSGNIGIGTDSPLADIHILRENTDARLAAMTFSSLANDDAAYLSLLRARGDNTTPAAVNVGDRLGKVEFLGFNSQDNDWGEAASIYVEATETWNGTGFKGGKMIFRVDDNGGLGDNEVLTLNHDGNVGINQTIPSEKLHIQDGTIRIDDGANPYTLPTSDGNSGDIISTDGAGNLSWGPAVGDADWVSNAGTVYNNTDLIAIGTNAAFANYALTIGQTTNDNGLRINNSSTSAVGSVYGINNNLTGATTAGSKYGVYNQVSGGNTGNWYGTWNNVTGTGASTNYIMGSYNNVTGGDGNKSGIYNNVQGGGAGSLYGIQNYVTANANNSVRSSYAGAFGTGANTPTLEAVYAYASGGDGNKTGVHSRVEQNSTEITYAFKGEMFGSNPNRFGIYITGEERSYISGDLGIGTSNPAEKLHVQGGSIRIDDGANPYTLPSADATTANHVMTSDAAGTLTWVDPATLLGFPNELSDLDNDTKIEVEQSADEDVIHFHLGDNAGYAAQEYFRMVGPRLDVINPSFSVFVGEEAGANDDMSGNQGVFIGYFAGNANTTGQSNVGVGMLALGSNTTGGANTAVGGNTLGANVIGIGNTAIGFSSQQATTGGQNTSVGNGSMNANTSGTDNTAVGAFSLSSNTTGVNNAAVGRLSFTDAFANENTGLGAYSGQNTTAGGANTFVGVLAGSGNTTGSDNVALGSFAGDNLSTGSNNLLIGHNAETALGNLTNATAIGSNAQVAQSNSVVIGSINGTNGATADANVGIGTVNPSEKLTLENGNFLLNGGHHKTAGAGISVIDGPNGANSFGNGNDVAGFIGCDAGIIGTTITINYAVPYTNPPVVNLTPRNAPSAQLQYYVVTSTTGFTIEIVSNPNVGATMEWNYMVIEH